MPSTSTVRSPSSTVVYSFSLISWLTPSSSPPTTPTSISKMILAALVWASSSSAMERFSSTGTADPSHMCDWNSGSSPRATRSAEMASSGRTYLSRLFLGQWSVCRATLIG